VVVGDECLDDVLGVRPADAVALEFDLLARQRRCGAGSVLLPPSRVSSLTCDVTETSAKQIVAIVTASTATLDEME
jgi:hypothetical protein